MYTRDKHTVRQTGRQNGNIGSDFFLPSTSFQGSLVFSPFYIFFDDSIFSISIISHFLIRSFFIHFLLFFCFHIDRIDVFFSVRWSPFLSMITTNRSVFFFFFWNNDWTTRNLCQERQREIIDNNVFIFYYYFHKKNLMREIFFKY